MKSLFFLLIGYVSVCTLSFAQNYQILYSLPEGSDLISNFWNEMGRNRMESFDYEGDGILEIIYVSDGKIIILNGANYTPIEEISLNDIGMNTGNFDKKSGFFDMDGDGIKELVFDCWSQLGSQIKIIDIRNDSVEFTIDNSSFIGCIDLDNDGLPELIAQVGEETQIWGVGKATKINTLHNSPSVMKLTQNYPNPFNPDTTIHYEIQANADVELAIYNTSGQLIRTLVNEKKLVGTYSVRWDGKNQEGVSVATGAYFYQLKAGNFVSSKKMIMLK